jgi:hypothetical protein
MFRKMAIALVAASVFTAPVLAQTPPLSGGGTTSTPSSEAVDKTKPEKSAETTEKAGKTKHHRMARHHKHGTKAAKYGKAHTTAMSGKHSEAKAAKLAKIESRRHGRTLPKKVYGRASKHMPSKSTTQPKVD